MFTALGLVLVVMRSGVLLAGGLLIMTAVLHKLKQSTRLQAAGAGLRSRLQSIGKRASFMDRKKAPAAVATPQRWQPR